MGGIAVAVMKMAFGNGIGFEYSKDITLEKIFGAQPTRASFSSLRTAQKKQARFSVTRTTAAASALTVRRASRSQSFSGIYENKLESVYSCNIKNAGKGAENFLI